MSRKLAPGGRSRTASLIDRSPRVHCAASAASVRADLTALTGVLQVHTDAATSEVRVTYRPDLIGPAALRAVLAASSPALQQDEASRRWRQTRGRRNTGTCHPAGSSRPRRNPEHGPEPPLPGKQASRAADPRSGCCGPS
jgi:copper chaperone CopZ